MPSKFSLTIKELIEEGEEKNENPKDLGGIWEHKVKLDDLEPGVQYAYICGNADHGWSGISTFTAPRTTTSPRLAIVGTVYDTDPSSAAISNLYSHNIIEPLDLIVLFAADDTAMLPHLQTLQNSIPTLYVPFSKTDENYSVGFNDIYLIFLNTNNLGTDEVNWLGDELYESRKYSWVFVFGHNPTPPTTVDLTQKFDSHGVHMYISLDRHNYSRKGYDLGYKNNGLNTTLYVTEPPLHAFP